MIWKSLADVLENLENIETDFAEYRYRDSLVEQVKHCLFAEKDKYTSQAPSSQTNKIRILTAVNYKRKCKTITVLLCMSSYFICVTNAQDNFLEENVLQLEHCFKCTC